MTYDYADFSTYQKAEDYLDYMWASGLVSVGEFPQIKRRGKRWYIVLRATY